MVHRASEPSPPKTLLIPPSSESSRASPLSRVRSRSAPFSEMSPIQEAHKETVSDSPVGSLLSSPTGQQWLKPPKKGKGRPVVVRTEEAGEEGQGTKKESAGGEAADICFLIGSSDDSCCSSDSETGEGDGQLLDPHSNLVNATTTHPPAPDQPPFLPCPSRSPRCSGPLLMDVQNVKSTLAALGNASPNIMAQGSTPTGSRPSPCPRRSSDSEINVTPKGDELNLCIKKLNHFQTKLTWGFHPFQLPVCPTASVPLDSQVPDNDRTVRCPTPLLRRIRPI